MQAAPFYSDVADGPGGGAAWWHTTSDGVRIRIGVWGEGTGEKGTVLLFPGRTEYIEKYGRTARDLQARGYATLAIDWRGQGLSDRPLDDRATGHVMHFTDYQHDVAAALAAARALGLPEPFYLLGHSMGGAIGLRSLIEGLPVKAAVFTGPMWGILIAPPVRPAAWALSWMSRNVGMGHKYAPGTTPETYVNTAPFEGNLLTSDPEMYAYMQGQLAAHPDLALGGPSLHWLYEALAETRILRTLQMPETPILTFLGTNERIADSKAVRARADTFPNGQLEMIEGAEHEVLMETRETRDRVFDAADALFSAHR